jgi:hypothetical protein
MAHSTLAPRYGKGDAMMGIAALVLTVFVVVVLIVSMVAELRQHRNINRSAISSTERDHRSTNRLAG